MKLIIAQPLLLKQIQRCQSIVEKKNTKPILCNLCLKALPHQLEVIGTDLQMAISAIQEAEVLEEGAITVSAQKAFEIIKELDANKPVELMLENSFLTIKSGRSRFRLITMPCTDFPGMPHDETDMVFTIEQKFLSKMIQSTAFAMSSDNTRKHLTGALFETEPNIGFRIVSTDTHRLNLIQMEMEYLSQAIHTIVPSKTVIEMKKIAENDGGMIELGLSKQQVRLQCGAYTLISKVIDGTFPAYQDVIPTSHPYEIKINCKALDKALRRCMIVANEVTHDLCIQFTAEGLHIAAHNSEQEQSEEFVEAQGSEIDMSIGFNGRYLRDVLNVLDSEEISMNYRDELSPILLSPVGQSGEKYIVMPMRI
ncbi:MAG: DNA polymerase III subunit beta [Mariprofundaceae bacterium]|nr:DNA polymerase III subunit beta [Mariprofundaceae bacterium]